MREFRSFADVHPYLSGLMSETRSRHEAYTLDNMRTLMSHLGNPQNSYKTIHVAGTSGKSSTCYYLTSMLKMSAEKVGTTVSPHLDEVNERVQTDGVPLSEKAFCGELSIFLKEIEPCEVSPTYFELLVAFAYWEFARQNVDYAVIEVGLGGLLDGTNVISRGDKVCVITDIGLDHTSTLGKSLTAIAEQKAGIILPSNDVFSYRQSDEIMEVIREVCRQKKAKLYEVEPDGADYNLPLFQQRNWYLAYCVYKHIAERDNLPALNKQQQADSAATYIPARMETLHVKEKTVVLDGAHNPQKLAALIKSISHAYPGQKLACLVGFVRTKEVKIHDNLEVLLPIASNIIVTGFQDTEADHHSTDPERIHEQLKRLNYSEGEIVADPNKALARLLERPESILLITGSFFLLQILRPLILHRDDSSDSHN